ncbi:hypothetical protein, partial [Mesorhizobium sp. f-mel]
MLSRRARSLIWPGNAVVGAPRRSIGSVQTRIQRRFPQPRRTGSHSSAPVQRRGCSDPSVRFFTESLAKEKGMKRAGRVLQIAAGVKMIVMGF